MRAGMRTANDGDAPTLDMSYGRRRLPAPLYLRADNDAVQCAMADGGGPFRERNGAAVHSLPMLAGIGCSMIFAHIRTRFADAFFPRMMEWQAASVMSWGGFMLFTNDDLMATSPKGYSLMLEWASQPTWAWFASVLGISRLVVLVINGAWRRSPHARAVTAFLACGMWFPLSMSFSTTAGWGFVLATGMLCGDALNIIRTARDARTVDDMYRPKRDAQQ